MEPSDHAKACSAEAERIIKSLLVVAEREYAERRQGQKLPVAVKSWWMMHYRSKFYFALDYKGNVYDDDREDLEKKAVELGRALGACKNDPPTREDASRASFLVDCPEEEEPVKSFFKWCN